MDIFSPAILQPLVKKLNALHVWDDDISRLLEVHPVLSMRLVEAGLRKPIIADYFNAIRSGDERVYLSLKPSIQQQFAIITKKMGFDIFLTVMSRTKLIIDPENAKHSPESLAQFEYFVAIIHGQYEFAMRYILNDPTDRITMEQPIKWLLCGYRHNPEVYKVKISESLKNYRQYTFGSVLISDICKVGGLPLFTHLWRDGVFEFTSAPSTMETHISSMMKGCDLNADECESFQQLIGCHSAIFVGRMVYYAAKNGRVKALRWASSHCTDVARHVGWYDVIGSDCKEVYEWYTGIFTSPEFKVIYNERMSADSMEYLHERKLAIPATNVLLSHPDISLERAQTFDHFPGEIYYVHGNHQVTNTAHFWFAMHSFDNKKVEFVVDEYIGKHVDLLQLHEVFISGLLSWSIPKHCIDKDFGAFLNGVLATLRIPRDTKDATFRRFREQCSCICTIQSESARRYIERYMAEPFTPHYYIQQAYRLLDTVTTTAGYNRWHRSLNINTNINPPSLTHVRMAQSLNDYLLLEASVTDH